MALALNNLKSWYAIKNKTKKQRMKFSLETRRKCEFDVNQNDIKLDITQLDIFFGGARNGIIFRKIVSQIDDYWEVSLIQKRPLTLVSLGKIQARLTF